jgi:hypothetical protein
MHPSGTFFANKKLCFLLAKKGLPEGWLKKLLINLMVAQLLRFFTMQGMNPSLLIKSKAFYRSTQAYKKQLSLEQLQATLF